MTLILSGTNGVSDIDGDASTPAIRGTDANTGIFFGSDIIGFSEGGTECARFNADAQFVAAAGTASLPVLTTTGDLNTGIFFPAADTIAFAEGGAEAMRIDSSGRVGIGTSSPSAPLTIVNSSVGEVLRLTSVAANIYGLASDGTISAFTGGVLSGTGGFVGTESNHPYLFRTNNTERARITSGGDFLVGKTAASDTVAGFEAGSTGRTTLARSNGQPLNVCRLTNDGSLVDFQQDGTVEGNISVSGTTVSYNGGNLSRWAQMLTKPDLLKGTVMSNLDEMNEYVDAEGNPVENEQLNKVKVSDVEGDANVAGVFVNWTYDEAHQVDEINMAMTGDMIIRIAQGVTVARGDLLMSAGDGTAMPQGDDIVRSKTIAKVTSTHVTCTYEDGSYCVPCVLMAC